MNLLGFTGTKPLGDVALVGAGVAMAAGSLIFASYMLINADSGPRINGMQYLAIFDKPRGAHPMVLDAPPPAPKAAAPVAHASPVPAAAAAPTPIVSSSPAPTVADVAPRVAGEGLDMAPTGSIARSAATAPSVSGGFRILSVEPGVAWLTNGAEIRAIRTGDVAPGLGRVASIEKRDGRWTLIGDSGSPVLTEAPQSRGADLFSRRMIFGVGD